VRINRAPERLQRQTLLAVLAVGIRCAAAAEPATASDSSLLSDVTITATRIPESLAQIPASLSTISGEELRARDARDLASALSLVSGVEAPAGGDAGPSSAVPSFWGLHEFDAFLLVVDQVPWGGAYNPGITTLNLNDVERIEVLKGAAPVMYGATSFVGVVHVLHYPAGESANQAEVALGSYGSVCGAAPLRYPSGTPIDSPLPLTAKILDLPTGARKSPTATCSTAGPSTSGRGNCASMRTSASSVTCHPAP